VLLVFDFAVGGIAEGGAQDADGILAMALDFEMDGMSSLDGSKYALILNKCKRNNLKCMATFETNI
jgi:hypothetical protein